MSTQDRLYHLMAQREKLRLSTTSAKLRTMREDHENTQNAAHKISSLLQEKKGDITHVSHPAQLQATHWFGTELAAQLDITRNRAEMLAGQQDGVQRELTQIETRFDMLSDRATTARRQAAQDKQDRANEQNGGTRRR
ncbi:MAG: hypothetical protein VXY73_00930 [Pseudomonadota bacterium]|jgi:hypothetical protein|nr:hypothetical protein [Pseudomonadota bacterium]